MKNKGLKISIFLLAISLCAFGFLSIKNSPKVYAAETVTKTDCYYLLGDENNVYRANTSVGKIEGEGGFGVGKQNVVLKTEANKNYQLVGWQVTYNEQSNRQEYFDNSGLVNNSKTITLSAKDTTDDGVDNGEQIDVVLNFTERGGYFTSGTFNISKVFEDITIYPVFDHIYYQVDIDELVTVSSHNNFVMDETNAIYYQSSSESGGVVTYTNAYAKIDGKHFYYGDLYFENGNYYTFHQTLEDIPVNQKVEYTRGAFRVQDEVNIAMDVDIIEGDFNNSRNVDIKGATANGGNLLNDTTLSKYYTINKDSYLRTESYNICMLVEENSNYLNTIGLKYHELYFVDINLLVDGVENIAEQADILGNLSVSSNSISSNLSIYNFYSIIDVNNLTFLVKTAVNNNSRSFGLSSVETVNATTANGTYRYYSFEGINTAKNSSVYFSKIEKNTVVEVKYASVQYAINFKVAENVGDATNSILVEMSVDVPVQINLKRGSKFFTGENAPEDHEGNEGDFYFDKSSTLVYTKVTTGWEQVEGYEALNITGYEFSGFASSLTDELTGEYEYIVDATEPVGTTVYLCVKKSEFEVVLTNYNQVQIGTTKPLNSIAVTKTNAKEEETKLLISSVLTEESLTITDLKFKLGDTLTFSHVVNNGFAVRYSLLSPTEIQDLIDAGTSFEEMAQYYFANLNFTDSFIADNVEDAKVTIYIYEEKLEFSITYLIDVATDDGSSYVMADINIIDLEEEQSNDNFSILKYDLEGVLISAENGNLTADVSKIVVAGLYLNDQITLFSKGRPFDADSYVFNWFIDGRVTLSFESDGTTYNHYETITTNREVKVVYSIPVAQVMVTLDEEFLNTAEFEYLLSLKIDGVEVAPNEGFTNIYTIDVGETVDFTIGGLGFGYNFVGYQVNENSLIPVGSSAAFSYVTTLGANVINLKFNRDIFQFYFAQYGAIVDGQELQGEYVDFGGKSYAELTVDNTFVDIIKPFGYYVETITVNNTEINANVENNIDYRSFSSVNTYRFSLTREDFITIVTTLGLDNNPQDEIIEVYVDVTYKIYMYDIVVHHTDPQGSKHGENVQYLGLSVNYTLNGEEVETSYLYNSDVVSFTEIVPYGAVTTINVLGTLQTGLRFVGWAHVDTNLVSYTNGAKYVNLGEVKNNHEFLYMFTYDIHKLKIEYAGVQGSPTVEINGEPSDALNSTINLFDNLRIVANATRANGYKFKAFKVNRVLYNTYSYNINTWSEVWNEVYILDGHAYVRNTIEEFNAEQTYYVQTVFEETYNEMEELSIQPFIVGDYLVVDKTIYITVEYELLQLAVAHTVVETQDGSITSEDRKELFNFNINDLLIIDGAVLDAQNVERVLLDGETVNFYEVITLEIEINSAAVNNVDKKEYDLSLGITLSGVQVSGNYVVINRVEGKANKYLVQFSVGEFLPETGEEIYIIYAVQVQQKNIVVTTVVTESESFYGTNVRMNATADPVLGGTLSSLGSPQLDVFWQYMTPLQIYTSMNSSYKELFKISGVKVYLTELDERTGLYRVVGDEIKEEDYSLYGISVSYDENGECRAGVSNLMHNLKFVFRVQPKITYNNGPSFKKDFECDSTGGAVAQMLTVGSTDAFDIQVANEIKDSIKVQYQLLKNGVLTGTVLDEVLNAGEYKVILSFDNTEAYDWLKEVELTEAVSFTVVPRKLSLTYDVKAIQNNKVEKVYDRTSNYDYSGILKYLILTDGNKLNLSYESLLNSPSRNLLLTSNLSSYISKDDKGTSINQANELIYYNLYLYNIALQNTSFNSNFNLLTKGLTINEYIKITKKVIDLDEVYVYDKVYDGNDVAELKTKQGIVLKNKYEGDNVILDQVDVRFADVSVGTNKTVVVMATLGGTDAGNYKIKNLTLDGLTIYPYSVSVTVGKIGEITIYNKRGLTDKNLVNLIPLNASLNVTPIYADSVAYSKIYGKISQFLRGNNEFAVGYKLSMFVGGDEKEISNDLYLSVPKVKHITGAYFLTGSRANGLEYKISGNRVNIDLKSVNGEIERVFLTKKRILLKPWQIVLIVLTCIAIIAAVVLAFIIIRKRKHKVYSIHEKI